MQLFWAVSVVSLALAFTHGVARAEASQQKRPVPAPHAREILVEKAARRLTVRLTDGSTKTYKVALGGSPVGPKECRGDKRTPEGRYVISGRNAKSSFHLSLRVSYPSEDDKRKARTRGCDPGGDIMVHGLPNWSSAVGAAHVLYDWTNGCIAVTNSEIEELWKLVPVGTPIVIEP